MDIFSLILLVAGGAICGIVNVVGGGGSLFALPVLLAMGLPAGTANGTNRLSIFLQDVTAMVSFRKRKEMPVREASKLIAPVVLGAIVGSLVAAVCLTELLMNIVLLIIILFMIGVMWWKPDAWLRTKKLKNDMRLGTVNWILFLLAGFYGGFIQAGFTWLVMALLVLRAGNDMISSDAVKMFLNMIITPFTMVIFWYYHQIDWLYGGVMGLGGILGGWLGVRFVSSWSPALIRKILLGLLIVSALYVILFRF